MAEPTLLDRLREQRGTKVDEWSTLIDARESERAAFEARTDTTEADVNAFRTAEEEFRTRSAEAEAEIIDLDERIRHQEDVASRRKAAADASVDVRVTAEPLTYRQDNARDTATGPGVSYFRDLAITERPGLASRIRNDGPATARARLERHAAELDVEMPKRAEAREARARRKIEEAEGVSELRYDPFHRGRVESPYERRATPNRTDGAGGYFVPPLWLIDEYIPGLRAGRVAAGLVRQMDLPQGTDSINIPKLSTLTKTGVQQADAAPVTSQDFTDTSVQANVKTIAGQADIGIQLLEMSPGQIIDEVLVTDLTADYNQQLDLQVVSGNGTNASALNGGQMVGLYSSAGASGWTSYNGITYTDGSPAAWKFFSVAGAMASQIAQKRFTLDGLVYLLHPRRAFWFATGVDANNRPLVNPSDFAAFNSEAIEEDTLPAEGLVMRMPWGPPVYHDANLPTADTAGGGTLQDVAIALLRNDFWLFEGEMRTRVLPEVLSGTLAVRFQVFNYIAGLARYGQSIAIGSGSGFAAPTGAVSSITF